MNARRRGAGGAHAVCAGRQRLFATHPPMAERIRELDPSSTCEAPAARCRAKRYATSRRTSRRSPQSEAVASRCSRGDPTGASVAARPGCIAAQVGQLDNVHIAQAHDCAGASGSAARVCRVVPSCPRAGAGIAPEPREAVRDRQLRASANALDPDAVQAMIRQRAARQHLAPMLRLPALLQIFRRCAACRSRDRRTLASSRTT